ncbi:hypothetical protein KFE94_05150 [bacterium SCSIO 12643]|nr:hypothetical protein KFE94_05150 [bacterium SCSIO 12643]
MKKLEKGKVIVKNSFKISNLGVVAELQHHENGLPKGILLKSLNSGLSWSVRSRMLFEHAMEVHQIFAKENTEKTILRFGSIDQKKESIREIQVKEQSGIYQYVIEPISHEQKPDQDMELMIIE